VKSQNRAERKRAVAERHRSESRWRVIDGIAKRNASYLIGQYPGRFIAPETGLQPTHRSPMMDVHRGTAEIQHDGSSMATALSRRLTRLEAGIRTSAEARAREDQDKLAPLELIHRLFFVAQWLFDCGVLQLPDGYDAMEQPERFRWWLHAVCKCTFTPPFRTATISYPKSDAAWNECLARRYRVLTVSPTFGALAEDRYSVLDGFFPPPTQR
jgi:hypothetical protein